MGVFEIIVSIVFSWILWCNHRTFKDRMRLVKIVYAKENYREASQYYEEINYYEHLIALVKFQNPWALYDPLLWFMEDAET